MWAELELSMGLHSQSTEQSSEDTGISGDTGHQSRFAPHLIIHHHQGAATSPVFSVDPLVD